MGPEVALVGGDRGGDAAARAVAEYRDALVSTAEVVAVADEPGDRRRGVLVVNGVLRAGGVRDGSVRR